MARGKKRSQVTIQISGNNQNPYSAKTEVGVTMGYPTIKSLEKALNFIFGNRGWVEVDRRLV